MELRDYQLDCLEKIKKTFANRDNQLIQLPTGAGKTYIFLKYIKENTKKSLIICPTRELLDQIEENSKVFHLENDIFVKREGKFKKASHYLIATASLNLKATRDFLISEEFDMIIIDEAHKAHCKTYLRFLNEYRKKYPNFKLLGLTATPERMDKKPLLDIFGILSFEKSIFDLIKEGYLCDIKSFRIRTHHKLRAKSFKADFQPAELKKLDCPSRNNLVYQTYLENCKDKKTLIFCVSIEHSERLSEYFQEKGIKAESIYGKMTLNERRAILNRFKNGNTQVLTNCQLLTEGFDAPFIQAIIIARPTRSKALYTQMIGRGLRIYKDKDFCYLYELTDNAFKICTFNVLTGKETDFEYEYKPGITLTDLKKQIDKISLTEFNIDKKEFSLLMGFEDHMSNYEATESQRNRLSENKINIYEPLSFLEASFLLWKFDLRKRYGYI